MFISLSVAEFLARYPEYSTVNPLTIQAWLDDAQAELGDAWDFNVLLKRKAQGYLAAHFGFYFGKGGTSPSGPVTSQKVGDVQESYGASTLANEYALMNTQYGQEFIRLRRSVIFGAKFV